MLTQETDFGHENIVFYLNCVLKNITKRYIFIENDVCLLFYFTYASTC